MIKLRQQQKRRTPQSIYVTARRLSLIVVIGYTLAVNTAAASTCEQGYTGLCAKEGLAQQKKGNIRAAEKLYRRGCDDGSAVACFNLGGMLYGAGDHAGSEPWFQRACELKDGIACTNIGVFAQQAKDSATALKYFAKACSLGQGPACISWTQVAQKVCGGEDFALCMREAAAAGHAFDSQYLYGIACKAGHSPACASTSKGSAP